MVLTGTPLENRLEELVSIVQFVDRFRLGPTFRLLDTHQKKDEVGKVIGYERLDELGKTLSKRTEELLARTKELTATIQDLKGRTKERDELRIDLTTRTKERDVAYQELQTFTVEMPNS